mmetsp:Transcript_6935/g.16940  ORF Transcript_6935/g.16940 Transcript_6935/m.16940 type:complete len:227 (+) Transcript_6935:663-1343(+)
MRLQDGSAKFLLEDGSRNGIHSATNGLSKTYGIRIEIQRLGNKQGALAVPAQPAHDLVAHHVNASCLCQINVGFQQAAGPWIGSLRRSPLGFHQYHPHFVFVLIQKGSESFYTRGFVQRFSRQGHGILDLIRFVPQRSSRPKGGGWWTMVGYLSHRNLFSGTVGLLKKHVNGRPYRRGSFELQGHAPISRVLPGQMWLEFLDEFGECLGHAAGSVNGQRRSKSARH